MKTEILHLISKQLHSKSYKDDVVKFSSDLINFYESQRDNTTRKFIKFLEKYNFETMSDFSEYPEYPHVTLFHGSGGLEFWPVIDYEGGVTGQDEEIGTILTEPSIYLNEEIYDQDVQDEIIDLGYGLRHSIVFVFLSTIWQKIEGYKYGILVKTLENNSVRQFIFNDLSWQDLSEYGYYNNKEKRLTKFFNRGLSVYELLQRINSDTYPVNPYLNKWRKFENQHSHIELAGWGNEVGIRQNSNSLSVIDKVTLKDRLLWEHSKSNELINEGYKEVFYENHKEKIHPKAIEFRFHSGINWYSNELENRLSEETLKELENQLEVSLPFFFREYLRLFNGRKFNKYYSTFVKPDKTTIKIIAFYDIEEIRHKNIKKDTRSIVTKLFNKLPKEKLKWLKIAESEKGEIELGVTKNNKGVLKIGTNEEHDSRVSFEELMKTSKH